MSNIFKRHSSKFVAGLLLAGLLGSSASALPFIGIEAGGIASNDMHNGFNTDTLAYGAYGRLWLKPGNLRVAGFAKWEYLPGILKEKTHNIQYGAAVGYAIAGIVTPYIGTSYSTFTDYFKNTWALNYGVHVTLPLVPLAVGIEASYQKPEIGAGVHVEMHRIGITAALQF